MNDIPPLDALGDRIWISGPSGGGKSTLAQAIGRKLGFPVIHLDQLRFVPGKHWLPRPDDAFTADVEAAMTAERWVLEGNYFSFVPSRLQRATGLINLSSPRLGNYARFLRRSLLERERHGRPDGARDLPNWTMAKWILWEEPQRRVGKRDRLRASGLPLVETNSFAGLRQLYRSWNLD